MHSSHGCSPPRCWKPNAAASIATLTSRIATAAARLSCAGHIGLEHVAQGDEAAEQHHEEGGGEQCQIALDEATQRRPELPQQGGDEEESRAARCHRGEAEFPEVESGDAAGDRDDLVWEGREARSGDDPEAPDRKSTRLNSSH